MFWRSHFCVRLSVAFISSKLLAVPASQLRIGSDRWRIGAPPEVQMCTLVGAGPVPRLEMSEFLPRHLIGCGPSCGAQAAYLGSTLATDRSGTTLPGLWPWARSQNRIGPHVRNRPVVRVLVVRDQASQGETSPPPDSSAAVYGTSGPCTQPGKQHPEHFFLDLCYMSQRGVLLHFLIWKAERAPIHNSPVYVPSAVAYEGHLWACSRSRVLSSTSGDEWRPSPSHMVDNEGAEGGLLIPFVTARGLLPSY